VTRTRKLLALRPKERTGAIALSGLIVCVSAFAYNVAVLGSRYWPVLVFGGLFTIGVWKWRAYLTMSSLGVALIQASLFFGLMGACIALTGYAPQRFDSPHLSRDKSIPLLVGAAVGCLVGAVILTLGRRRATHPPNNRWRGP
jgi:hypothetical protein